jgi:hypothetical protein
LPLSTPSLGITSRILSNINMLCLSAFNSLSRDHLLRPADEPAAALRLHGRFQLPLSGSQGVPSRSLP